MKHLQELLSLSAVKVHEESIPQKKLWTILLHPEDGAPGAKPYPKAQVNKLVKYLSRKGVVNVLQNDAKNLKLHVAFNDSWTEDSVWDMIQSADLDDALSWGGSVRAAKKLAEDFEEKSFNEGMTRESRSLAEASPDKNGIMPLSYKTGKGHKIEAYGVKGMQSKRWRKSFKDEAALEKWCDDNDATVHGVADIKESLNDKFMDLTPDQNRALEHEISDHMGFDVEVDSVTDLGNGTYRAYVSYDDPKTSKARHHGVKFRGSFKKQSVEDFVIAEGLNEGVEDMDLDTLIDNWMDKEKAYRMEGPAGYRNLSKLVRLLGYREMTDFLEDNSGAIESIVNWVREQNFPEWKKGFEAYAGDSEGDEE